MNFTKLQSLGWSNFFLQQLDFEQLDNPDIQVLRISAIHRDVIKALGESDDADNVVEQTLLCPLEYRPVSQFIAVGDWVVAQKTNEHFKIVNILESQNRIERLSNQQRQLICANLDYLFIVTSANDEFNQKRLQRYLALAYEFDISPVVILSKIDECEDFYIYLDQIKNTNVDLVYAINSFDETTLKPLNDFLLPANSIAFVGSSGVGKSTLVNQLFGETLFDGIMSDELKPMKTADIREDDKKGKHTTTHRELLINKSGVIFIDTPGMRELQLLNAQQGIEFTFADIVDFAQSCKFKNCSHQNEKGCGITTALQSGELDLEHYNNYKKLLKEEAFNQRQELGAYAEKLHQKELHMMYKQHKK